MDNDMVLLGNIDELAEHAEAPGMVWHTATVLARKERSAVTGGNPYLKPGLNHEPRPNPNPEPEPDPQTRSAPPSRAACLCSSRIRPSTRARCTTCTTSSTG